MKTTTFLNQVEEFFVKNLQVIFQIILILVITAILLRVIHVTRKNFEQKIIDKRVNSDQQARLKTLLGAGLATFQVIILATAILMILLSLGINITPVLASAGIAGLAVSLGAQTLIKDYIGGIIILFENQYNVGELIQVGDVTGTVEQIELRATYVRDVQGRLFTIPNGDVRTLSNSSRDWNRALVDLNIAFDTDMEQLNKVLQRALLQASQDEEFKSIVLEEPKIQNWLAMTEWAIQVRISVRTLADKQVPAAVILRKYVLEGLQEAGISLATPPGLSR